MLSLGDYKISMIYRSIKKFVFRNKFLLFIFNKIKNYCQNLQKNKIFGFLKKKIKLMKDKNLLSECKCIHCKQKLEQINSSKLYWDKLANNKVFIGHPFY